MVRIKRVEAECGGQPDPYWIFFPAGNLQQPFFVIPEDQARKIVVGIDS